MYVSLMMETLKELGFIEWFSFSMVVYLRCVAVFNEYYETLACVCFIDDGGKRVEVY